jgi:inner membrane protein
MENTEPSLWQRQATTIKGVLIFILLLVLLIPTSMIDGLINERQSRQQEAVAEVSGKWGQSQSLTGPVLAIPYQIVQRAADGKEISRETKYTFFLPDDLTINGVVNPEKRHRGIFDVVLYSSKITLEGAFPIPTPSTLVPANAEIMWSKAVLQFGIPDLRGLQDQVSLQWDGQQTMFEPGVPVPGLVNSGINVALPLTPNDTEKHRFRIDVALKGSGSLFFTPLGKVTSVKLSSPWPDPSFTGAFLPDEKNVSLSGFDASWKVLNLNRNYPQQWNSDQYVSVIESTFGVDFILPLDNYQKSTRSVKYAILFIGLTFLTVFFVEMRQANRVHPFQYALIGLALVIFYTLLVAISEQTSFNVAYLISAVMTIGLTGMYAKALFDSGRMALLVSGALTLLYGFLFVVLQQQDYALLIGSLGLFVILGVVMYFSRKINW